MNMLDLMNKMTELSEAKSTNNAFTGNWKDPDDAKGKSIIHKGKYGTAYQGEPDDLSTDDTKKTKKVAPADGEKRGRGRPAKGSDSSGKTTSHDTQSLSNFMIGNKPSKAVDKLPKTKSKTLKDWFERLDTALNEDGQFTVKPAAPGASDIMGPDGKKIGTASTPAAAQAVKNGEVNFDKDQGMAEGDIGKPNNATTGFAALVKKLTPKYGVKGAMRIAGSQMKKIKEADMPRNDSDMGAGLGAGRSQQFEGKKGVNPFAKKKPDDDKDGVPNWADKKPGKDDNEGKKKGAAPKKGVNPFAKKTNEDGFSLQSRLTLPKDQNTSIAGQSKFRDMTKADPASHRAAQQIMSIWSKIDPTANFDSGLTHDLEKKISAWRNANMRTNYDTYKKLGDLWGQATNSYMLEQSNEALKGGQKNLDVDDDGKLEKSDFIKLRAKKKISEGKVKDIAIDLEEMTPAEFKKKYGMTKAEMEKNMNTDTNDNKKDVAEGKTIASGLNDWQKKALKHDTYEKYVSHCNRYDYPHMDKRAWQRYKNAFDNMGTQGMAEGFQKGDRVSIKHHSLFSNPKNAQGIIHSDLMHGDGTSDKFGTQVPNGPYHKVKTRQGIVHVPLAHLSEQGVAEGTLNELSSNTLSSYGKKAEKSNDKKLDKAADHTEKATNLYSKGTASAVAKSFDHEDKANNLHKQVKKRDASMDQAAGKLKKQMSKGMMEGVRHSDAAHLRGKAHAMGGENYNCRYTPGTNEANMYHMGFKEGLDECYGQMPMESYVEEEFTPEGEVENMPLMTDENYMMDESPFSWAAKNTPTGKHFTLAGHDFTKTAAESMNPFMESLNNQLNALLNDDINEGMTVSISKGQQGTPDSVSVSAQDSEAEQLLSIIKSAGLGLFGGDNDSGDEHSSAMSMPGVSIADGGAELDSNINVVNDHDGMLDLIRKMTGQGPAQSDDNDYESEEHEHSHDEECGDCGNSPCDCEPMDEAETSNQAEFMATEDNAPDSGAQETTADENAEAAEDGAIAKSDQQNPTVTTNENEMEEDLNESYANSAENTFEADIEFMTKVITGGLNKQKSTGQSTIPVVASQKNRLGEPMQESTALLHDWKKLSGIT